MDIINNCLSSCNKHARLIIAYPKIFFLTLAFSLFSSSIVHAQTGTISGTVKDPDNKPVEGATVTVKQTKVSSVADKEGNFSIKAVKGNTLIISSVNFEPQNLVLGNETTITIKLELKSGTLDDVVVIGYGTQKKKDLTGAVTSVNMKKTDEIPLTSIDQMLTGRAGGVQINQSSGQAGAGTSIRIRGGNSLNGTNEPLFVIDGFPIINDNSAFAPIPQQGVPNTAAGNQLANNPNGALNWLNPSDIQSVEILKDASATAIFGSRGANGVIIVTTKKGKSGQARLNFSTSIGISQLNDKNIKVMNGDQYAEYYNLSAIRQGMKPLYIDTTIAGKLFPSPGKIGAGTDWVDAVTRKGVTQNYSLGFSGGKDVLYSGSIAWLNQETPFLGSQFKRANFRLNIQTNLTNWLTLDNSVSYTSSTVDNAPSDSRDIAYRVGLFEAALSANPVEPAYRPDGSLNYDGRFDPLRPGLAFSPISLGNDLLNRNTVQTLLENLSLKAKIINGLTIEMRGSLFSNNLLNDIYYNSKTIFTGYNTAGLASKNTNVSNSYLIENFGTYIKNFGRNSFNAVLGYSYQKTDFRTVGASASNFPNDNLKNENLSAGSVQYPTQTTRIQDLLSSYYVRLNNILNDKYIFTFTARYDGSSKFGEGNKWAFFPSGAVSWKLKEEDFFKNSKTFSDLKLRISYGLSGNQAIQSLQSKSLLTTINYPIGGVLQTGIVPSVLGNPKLRWETTKQFNAGVDFGFMNQRITGSLNYYIKNTTDLLQAKVVPQNSGYPSIFDNVGSISNKGIELDLHAGIINGRNFKWDIDANFAHNKQKLTDIGLPGIDTLLVPFYPIGGSPANVALIKGQPVGLFWGYRNEGVFATQADVNGNPAIPGSLSGSRRFKDLNKDGVINASDQEVIGDPNPKLTYGFANSFAYKGFDLTILFQGSVGGDIYNLSDAILERIGNRTAATLDYWTPSNLNAKYAAPGDNVGRDYHSDFSVSSGSYLRLKAVTLGYNFQTARIKFVRSIRLFASGTNLLTFTGYKGFDPEINSFGQSNLFRNIDILTVPIYKTYSIGVNVGF